MKYRRQLRTPDREISRELHRRVFELTHRRVDCYMIDGRILVSRDTFERMRQLATPEPNASGNCFRAANGIPIFICSFLPRFEKLGSPHRQRWAARHEERRKKKEKMRQTIENEDVFCRLDELASLMGTNNLAHARRN